MEHRTSMNMLVAFPHNRRWQCFQDMMRYIAAMSGLCNVIGSVALTQRLVPQRTVFARVICAPAYFAHPNF